MHRSITLSLLLSIMAEGGAQASQFCRAKDVDAVGGIVNLARHWDTAFKEPFEKDLSSWQVTNYKGGLDIALSSDGPHVGAQCLTITSNGKSKDTAWEIQSQPLTIVPGSRVCLRFWLRNNRSLCTVRGHHERYWSRLQWLGAKGQGVSHIPITFGDTDEEWHMCSTEGEVPMGVAQVVIRLGFDSPNIGDKEYVALDDLELLARTDKTGYEPSGEFISRPIFVKTLGPERTISWDATVPAQASVKFQLRCAADQNNGPGEWSEFSGPERAQSFFTEPGARLPAAAGEKPWLQYRAVFNAVNRLASPTLRSVCISSGDRSVRDEAWAGVDEDPPTLAKYEPTRATNPSLPLKFSLLDAGVGLDPRTVRMWLDQTKVMPKRGDDGTYIYHPGQPLEPPQMVQGFERWGLRNYRRELRIRKKAPRTKEGLETVHVTRLVGRTDTAFALTSPEIPVQAGASYVLSYWIRTDMDLQRVDRRYAKGLRWYRGDNNLIGDPIPIEYGQANPDWREMRQELKAPAEAEYAIVSLGWDSPDIYDHHFVQFADVQLVGPHPKRPGAPNLHRVQISVEDFAGNRMKRSWYIFVKEAPKRGIVTVRDDGVTLIDGKPFFPIGIYSVSKRASNGNSFDRAFAELRAAGFNTAHTYNNTRGPDFREFYEMAVKHGMKLYVAPESGTNCADCFGALTTVVKECNEPALLAWYLGDDTSSHIGASELQRVHQAVRDVDPYHITTQADGCSRENDQRYADFVDSTTGFLPELYPIHKKTGNHIADVIRGMKNIQAAWKMAGRVTPVWAIIQDFEGWGWQRYPTNEEERCMVYLAIIHGAQGITWYTYAYRGDKHGAPWDPKVWAYLKGLAGQLASLSDVLTSRDPKQEQKVEVLEGPALGDLGYPSINLRLKEHNAARYLLAANSALQTVRARITAPGLKDGAEVLFENRKVAAKDGQLQDTFAPLAVHVYKW